MIPKGKKKTIVVNEVKYIYCVNKFTDVFIINMKSGKTLSHQINDEDIEVKPSYIKILINNSPEDIWT